MGNIRSPSDSSIGGADTPFFIQCICFREPQINKLWCLGVDRIFRKVHPTARVEIPDGTVGDFFTNYIAENGCQIGIISKIYVNDSVQFLRLSNQSWVIGLLFIANLMD